MPRNGLASTMRRRPLMRQPTKVAKATIELLSIGGMSGGSTAVASGRNITPPSMQTRVAIGALKRRNTAAVTPSHRKSAAKAKMFGEPTGMRQGA